MLPVAQIHATVIRLLVIALPGIEQRGTKIVGRGFAFTSDGPLDMRMNQQGDLTAEKVVNEYDEDQLNNIFWHYGELKNARRITKRIIEARAKKRITRTQELAQSIEMEVPSRHKNRFLAQVFQAIRIEVNGEMEALKELLTQCTESVGEDGRIAFITYHSLEDRLVKNFIRSGNFKGELVKDFYGNVIKPFDAVNRKPILPQQEELERNNRSRSAKLRIAKRNKDIE